MAFDRVLYCHVEKWVYVCIYMQNTVSHEIPPKKLLAQRYTFTSESGEKLLKKQFVQ